MSDWPPIVSGFAATLLDDPDAQTARSTLGDAVTAGGGIPASLIGTPAGAAAGTTFRADIVEVLVPVQFTATGIRYRVGATAVNNVRSALYDSAGTKVAGATASTAQTGAGADNMQEVPFSAATVLAPGVYFMYLIVGQNTSTYYVGRQLRKSKTQTEASITVATSITVPTATENVDRVVMTLY